MQYRVAVIGATGLVGRTMLKVLAERKFPFSELCLVASARSVGKEIEFEDKFYEVMSIADALEWNPNLALFSAGSTIALEWAPKFAESGSTVIDNSSAFRMDNDKKLIVPEINATVLSADDKIIANPNCSTIQMVMALSPLHEKYTIKRIVVSTYQSVSGTGITAVRQLESEREHAVGDMAYPHPIDKNCLPQCDEFTDNGYTKEEMKLVNETRKILGDQSINISATAVRVPVDGGHSESVNIEFSNPVDIDEIRAILDSTEGIIVQDDISNNIYPMAINAQGKDDVFVGRIRIDDSAPNSINMWIVSDNLRKGAATNAVQIAEYLMHNGLL